MDKDRLLYYSIFILILISSQNILIGSADIDVTKLGVSSGDEFEITIVKLTGKYLLEYQIYNNFYEGQIVKYQINDTTIYTGDTLFIEKIINSNNDTFIEFVRLDEIGGWIIYSDWEYWRANAVIQLLELSPDLTEDFIQVTETSDTFRIIIDISSTSSFFILEYIYDKTTGIANRLRIEFEVQNEDGFADGSFIFDRFPYQQETDNQESKIIEGDTIIIILSGFLLLVIVLRFLSKKILFLKKD